MEADRELERKFGIPDRRGKQPSDGNSHPDANCAGRGDVGARDRRADGAGSLSMIAFPSGARVWLAAGHTDMRKGFGSLALMVQEGFKRDLHAGDLWVFRGRRGDLIKLIWHDGDGAVCS
jgi:transposase